MNNKLLISIAKKYGYTLNNYSIEGTIFDKNELPLDSSLITKKIPDQILGISAEIQNSNYILGVFVDAKNPTIENILAIEIINTENYTIKLLNLNLLKGDF